MRSGLSRGQTLILVFTTLLGLAALGGGGWLLWNSELVQKPEILPVSATAIPAVQASPTRSVLETVVPLELPPTDAPAALPTPSPKAFDPLACLPAGAQAQDAQVQEVLSGEVLRVELDGKSSEVHLIGVDPAGLGGQDQTLLRELASGKTVRLLADGADLDEQGRLRRYVLAGATFVNYELVRAGAALPALYPPGGSCVETFLNAEHQARESSLGYWALKPGLPTSPAVIGAASTPVCDCGVAYACSDFKTRAAAQACYNACGDYRNTTLDPDHNGQACEDMP